MHASNFRRRGWQTMLREAELPLSVRIHDLRYTVAAQLLSNGAPVNFVKELLGHRSISVTVDTYGRWLNNSDRNLLDGLDDPEPTLRIVPQIG